MSTIARQRELVGRSGTLDRRVRRRYDLHPPGILYIVVTLFLAIGAFNSQNNLLFWAFGLAVAGIIVSGILSGSALMSLAVERRSVRAVPATTAATITYRVSNSSRLFPALALTIDEIVDGSSPLAPANAFVAHVGPGESVDCHANPMACRRGPVELTAIRVSTTFPFGLVRKTLEFRCETATLVLPAHLELREGLVRSSSAGVEQSVSLARRPGLGDEFYGVREYVPGDARRHIAWRRSAASGELIVRQHASPRPRQLWVSVGNDVHRATGDVDLYERAIALAGSVCRRALEAGYAVGLDLGAIQVQPGVGPAHSERLQRALALIDDHDDRRDAQHGQQARRDQIVVSCDGAAGSPGDLILVADTPEQWLRSGAALSVMVDPVRKKKRGRR